MLQALKMIKHFLADSVDLKLWKDWPISITYSLRIETVVAQHA